MPSQSFPIPLLGRGEQTAAAPDASAPGESGILENVTLSGPGQVSQLPDWRLLFQSTNDIGTPPAAAGTFCQANCGIFPFAQPVSTTPGAGVSFVFHKGDQKIYLEHLGEQGQLLRRIAAWSWTLANPPQITGFEWFGKFVAVPYGREAAAARMGLGIYDPVAGTFSVPTIEIVAGTAAAAALRFRGISKHRTMVLGWGYQSEETGAIDRPDFLRWTTPAGTSADLSATGTWQTGGTDDTSPGGAIIGTPGLPIVACAMSGLVSVIAKETELFSIEGENGGQLYVGRRLGDHGPKSTVSMVSFRDGAAWYHAKVGPVVSLNGDRERILGTDRWARRLATYFDPGNVVACHLASQNVVLWANRRNKTIRGATVSSYYPDELLVWNYEKDEALIWRPPGPIFAVGTINGKGEALVGPSGPPVSSPATNVTAYSAQANWANGDSSIDVTTTLRYRLVGAPAWTTVNGIGGTQVTYALSSLTPATGYEYQVAHVKNGQFSAWSATQTFTTAAGSLVASPTAFTVTGGGGYTDKGLQYWVAQFGWTRQEFGAGATTEFYEGVNGNFANASLLYTVDAAVVSQSVARTNGSTRYYWVRHVRDGVPSPETALSPNPLTFSAALGV